ncbi:MAG: glycosyltransferase family 2 protein [Flavobacterium sp.]|nr:glycosyltransferase family 2 protein [Pedobacter sp.]
MNPQVSVIYVNYNTSDLLIQSVKSLIAQCRRIPFEIIVIDNASREEERRSLKNGLDAIDQEQIKLVFSEINLGFGKANNLGTKHTKGNYLFFLNPDTIVVNDVLSLFYNFLESADKRIVACGGNLLKDDFTPNYSYGNFPGLLYEVCSIGIGLRILINKYYLKHIFIGKKIKESVIVKAPYIIGADVFIRARCFKDMKGFDENFFMYYEETDLFMRLHKKGYESYILPDAKIIHFEGGAVGNTSSTIFNHKKFELTFKSKLYYFSKWYSPYKVSLLKVIMLLQIIVQYIKGKQGNNFKMLLSIYWQIMRTSQDTKALPVCSR